MSKLQIAKRFLSFYQQADTVYGIHSPFIFDLAQAMFEDSRHFYAFSMIEPIRQMHLQNHHTIEVKDLGAGSKVNNGHTRKVSAIAKSALSSPYRSRLLFRIINHFKPKVMLEMGTSLGISALYQATASLNGRLTTLEGSPAIAKLAATSFHAYEVDLGIDLRVGAFDETLVSTLKDLKKVDYVFFDGNHQQQPTIDYFETCLKYADENTVFVFDDIYWSAEMEAAWKTIQAHPLVSLTVDCFYLGLVFFRKEQKKKQHFKVLPSQWKPWRMGFF